MYLSRISDRSRILSRESLNKLEGNDGKVVTEYNNIPIRQVNFSKLKTEFIIKNLAATEKNGNGGSNQTTSRVTIPTKQKPSKKHQGRLQSSVLADRNSFNVTLMHQPRIAKETAEGKSSDFVGELLESRHPSQTSINFVQGTELRTYRDNQSSNFKTNRHTSNRAIKDALNVSASSGRINVTLPAAAFSTQRDMPVTIKENTPIEATAINLDQIMKPEDSHSYMDQSSSDHILH